MKNMIRVAVLSILLAGGIEAGTIVGTVRAHPPTEPADNVGSDGKYQSRRYKFADRIDYEKLRDFVIYVDASLPATAGKAGTVIQKEVSFQPHVLPICVGTTVRWPNEDDIYHNVFSMSETKTFNLEFYHKEKVPAVTFDKAGRVDVFCGIHPHMHCIVLVLPNAYFGKSDVKGRFRIENVPAGKYPIKAWHERLPAQSKEIAVPAEGEVEVDFVLGLADLPKY